MVEKSKLYVDAQGVQRGYYVYVHKDAATGSIFYVGKGYGDRAWSRSGRNHLWKEHIDSLGNEWSVEIIRRDLSEIEAYELEAELVEKYGGAAATGGTLKNWIPGGEEPVAFTVGVQLGESFDTYFEAYAHAREFKKLPRKEQEATADSIFQALDSLLEGMVEVSFRADDTGDEFLQESIDTAESLISVIAEVCDELKKCRISWKDFCLNFEDQLEQLEFELENEEDIHSEAQRFMREAATVARSALQQFDTGNKEEADAFAQGLAYQD